MTQSDKLRADIRRSRLSIAELARRAGISLTTLHSFVSKPGSEMRTSNFEKVARALADLHAAPRKSTRRNFHEDAAAFEGASTITIEISLLPERAKRLEDSGADIAVIVRAGAEKALKEAEAKAWADANREAIEASSAWIEKHGTLAEQLGLI